MSLLDDHLGFVSDPVRLERYRAAIAATVRPGDRVVDLGCGSGVLGLMCLQAGAGHLHAIDATVAIEIARQSLTSAGWAPNTEFIHGNSFHTELAEKADVLVCDHVGYFGFDYGVIDMLADGRRRLLKPQGRLIPSRMQLRLGAVESEKCHAKAEGWQSPAIPREFHWVRGLAVNSKYAVHLRPQELLGDAADAGLIDLYADHPAFFSWQAELSMARDGVLHGLAGWFDCELADGIWMTNSPLASNAIQRPQAFFPLDTPLAVKAGDAVAVKVMARPADSLIAWEARHVRSGKTFAHSTWRGDVIMSDQLARSRPEHVPKPVPAALARGVVLTYCDGKRSRSQIEEEVLRKHPDLLPSQEAIRRLVAEVLRGDTV